MPPSRRRALRLQAFRDAKSELSAQYLRAPRRRGIRAISAAPRDNVQGVGIGEKLVAGRPTGVRAIKLLVRTKLPADEISPRNLLPATYRGLPVDVEEVGLLHPFSVTAPKAGVAPNPRSRLRPARPGSSIGFADPNNAFTMAGTFGALVSDLSGVYVLSNNHVLADQNKLPPGSPIYQPGLLDGGKVATDEIAKLTRFIPLTSPGPNSVDCAIAQLDSLTVANGNIIRIGFPTGIRAAAVDMIVHKMGRTTAYRVGRITSIDTDVKVTYDPPLGQLTFTSQIVISGLNNHAFSDAGDSGSLVVERSSGLAVGLLFAGNAQTNITLANHIGDVLTALVVLR
jgi:hypothetical protein